MICCLLSLGALAIMPRTATSRAIGERADPRELDRPAS